MQRPRQALEAAAVQAGRVGAPGGVAAVQVEVRAAGSSRSSDLDAPLLHRDVKPVRRELQLGSKPRALSVRYHRVLRRCGAAYPEKITQSAIVRLPDTPLKGGARRTDDEEITLTHILLAAGRQLQSSSFPNCRTTFCSIETTFY